MIQSTPPPHDLGPRVRTIDQALERFPDVVFAYVFGSFAAGRFGPLSDVGLAVFLDGASDPEIRRLDITGALTRHLGTDACLDVASHIVADRQLRVPSTYAEAFDVLREAGLADEGPRDAMVRIARFRNILVHDYARIEPAAIVRILRVGLDDLRRFREAALGWLRSPPPAS